ncbi:hypothetical protein BCT86_08790 [Vibrio breoganii]|uniref:fimbrial biogenesis chaperone n=1 Tax=Vibrio breoganii TaxID=553239 RepID=UPI000C834325|nr:fimbria/pilus periplasmic chaperone [Vibrio breoganii]PMG81719.1 hypothetical protein BCU83_01085 [Vibrio breoganii]PMG91223.1 hypothetical protein BCU80_01385 [Vibrio breoganii]PML08485.1 hypothetical protein BCT86_08790 [Vibrio breoganii]
MQIFRALFILIFSCTSVFAYEVSPMFQLLEVAGKNSQGSYEVINSDDDDIFLEAVVYEVSFDFNGKEKLTRAEEDFLVLPPQAQIKQGETQRFRVRYFGNALLPQTKVFRLIFEQIQTSDNPEGESTAVEFLVDFSTVVFVSPVKCQAKVTSIIEKGKLTLINPTNCVSDLNNKSFEFSGSSGTATVSWLELEAASAGYLLPKTQQNLKLPQQYTNYTKVLVIE